MNRSAVIKKLSRQIQKLPDEELDKLLQIVEDLSAEDLKCMKYAGVWKNRKGMEDSSAWVRQLRDEVRSL